MPPSNKDLTDLLNSLRDFDPTKLTNEVIATGESWADQDAAATSLEETKKVVLARLTLEYLAGGHTSGGVGEKPKSIPVSQAELRALDDPRYELHVNLMVDARKEAQRCRVRYDLGRMKLELMRSVQATLRNEMRMSSNT